MSCVNCGRSAEKHGLSGKCPIGQEVVITAEAIERLNRTGHPRLLGALLSGKARGMFTGVEITALRVAQ